MESWNKFTFILIRFPSEQENIKCVPRLAPHPLCFDNINCHVCVHSVAAFTQLVEPYRLKEDDMEQEAAEKLKAEEPWRITDNELELYKAKVSLSLRLSLSLLPSFRLCLQPLRGSGRLSTRRSRSVC